MSTSRREFLTITSLSALGSAAAYRFYAQNLSTLPPGAPPAFGAGPAFGPEVSTTTFAEAEKLERQALTSERRVFGPDDPLTARSMERLAEVLEREGHLRADDGT